jgi:oxygen-independent coproporphyrinogen-3 oxidase
MAIPLKNVPRYTSYPTAASFTDQIDSDCYSRWLSELDKTSSLSLYIHIPFCRQLCWFCGCHTKIINHHDPVTEYMGLLEQEVHLKSRLMASSPVEHIHFGGGSPTVVKPDEFLRFIDALLNNYSISSGAECAVEVDPRSVDEDKISAYSRCGVNRVSIGVQDFDDTVQQAINRIQPFSMVSKVVNNFRKHGIDAINLDLIYGLPYQTMESIETTVLKTISLSPQRISLFGYAHVPWMKKHQKMIPGDNLPDSNLRIRMYGLASSLLEEHGYVSVGLDHFAKKDDSMAKALECGELQRSFQGYTTDRSDALVGFGVSAISSLPGGYAQNTSKMREYSNALESEKLPICRGVQLTESDYPRREIIMSLMCSLSATVDQNNYSRELDILTPYLKSGDVDYQDGQLNVNPEARNRIRLIASVFDEYLQDDDQRFSKAV